MKTFKELREEKFQLVDMDPDTARVAVQLAKKAGLQPKSYKAKSGGLDISVEGPKKKVAKFIMSLPEQVEVDEASYVASDMDMVRSILSKIENDFSKLHLKKQFEKGWPTLQTLAKMAGYGITKKKQAKGRTFRYDLKR